MSCTTRTKNNQIKRPRRLAEASPVERRKLAAWSLTHLDQNKSRKIRIQIYPSKRNLRKANLLQRLEISASYSMLLRTLRQNLLANLLATKNNHLKLLHLVLLKLAQGLVLVSLLIIVRSLRFWVNDSSCKDKKAKGRID